MSDGVDSLKMTFDSKRIGGAAVVQLHMYVFVTALVVFSHVTRDYCSARNWHAEQQAAVGVPSWSQFRQAGAAFPLLTATFGWDDEAKRVAVRNALWRLHLTRMPLFPAFCVLAGLDDARHNWSWARLRHGLVINLVILYVLERSSLPSQFQLVQRRVWQLHPLLDGRDVMCWDPATETRSFGKDLTWWLVVLTAWRLVHHVAAHRLMLPPWLLPLASVLLHFGSGANLVYDEWQPSEFPLQWLLGCADGGESLCRRWQLASQSMMLSLMRGTRHNKWQFWIYYALAPHAMPRRFPLDLPMGTWLQRGAARILRCGHAGSAAVGASDGGAPGAAAGGFGVRLVRSSPRFFWLAAAVACYALGSLLVQDVYDAGGVETALARPWAWTIGGLYAQGAATMWPAGLEVDEQSPEYKLTNLMPYAHFAPTVGAHVARKGAWCVALELLMLNALSVGYHVLLVVALAAAMPRSPLPLLTTAGAGSLATYCTQMFFAPILLPPALHVVLRLLGAPDARIGLGAFVAAMLLVFVAYAVVVGSAAAKLVAALSSGGPLWRWRVALLVGLGVLCVVHAAVPGLADLEVGAERL